MTTPTQAQIEAAAKTLYGDHGRVPSDKAMAMAKAALTAAAEVDNGEIELPPDTGELLLKYTDKDLHHCEQATIERCAQVAENFPSTGSRSIAAAIRALKDQP